MFVVTSKLHLKLLDFQLSTSHVEQIRQHFVFLRDNILVDNALFQAYLQSKGVLSGSELQCIKQESVTQRANDKLLTLIMRKSSEQYQQFLICLQLTGQGFVVQRLSGESECGMFQSIKFNAHFTIIVIAPGDPL